MWFYIDFKVIKHDSEFASPLETTIIHAETQEDALAEFVVGMSGETYTIENVRTK